MKVKNIKILEEKYPVYDITIKNNHTFIVKNLVVHNCDTKRFKCLTGDTKILMSDGKSFKQIKDIIVGDIVKSYNTTLKEFENKKVKWSGKTRENAELVEVGFSNDVVIKCTPDHLILTECRYIQARDLDPSYDIIDYCYENKEKYKSVNMTYLKYLDYKEDTYDISVEDNLNFVIVL